MDYSNKNALKKALCEDFNKVGAKVVKVSEFMAAFEKAVKKEYGILNPLRHVLLAQKIPTVNFQDQKVRDQIKEKTKGAATGIYFDVANGQAIEKQENAYVDVSQLRDLMLDGLADFDTNKIPKAFHSQIDGIRTVIIKAASNAPDHTPKVAAGTIKPFIV